MRTQKEVKCPNQSGQASGCQGKNGQQKRDGKTLNNSGALPLLSKNLSMPHIYILNKNYVAKTKC